MSQRGLNKAIAAVQRMRRRSDPVQLAREIEAVGKIKSKAKSDEDLRVAVEESIRLGLRKKGK